jgi:hypothetical protein
VALPQKAKCEDPFKASDQDNRARDLCPLLFCVGRDENALLRSSGSEQRAEQILLVALPQKAKCDDPLNLYALYRKIFTKLLTFVKMKSYIRNYLIFSSFIYIVYIKYIA